MTWRILSAPRFSDGWTLAPRLRGDMLRGNDEESIEGLHREKGPARRPDQDAGFRRHDGAWKACA